MDVAPFASWGTAFCVGDGLPIQQKSILNTIESAEELVCFLKISLLGNFLFEGRQTFGVVNSFIRL